MSRKSKMVQLAKKAKKNETLKLSQAKALVSGTIEVDREKTMIRNVSIITRGPAVGHGFDVDDVMLEQVAAAIKRKPKGVKSRLTHPENSGGFFGGGTDPVEVMLGRVMNVKIVDSQVRGDVKFGKYAESSPKGPMATYLMDVAEEDPEILGLSITFIPDDFEERTDENNQSLPPAGRVRDVLAVDFVGDPGANPSGLLSEKTGGSQPPETTKGASLMNKKLRNYLLSVGLKAEATDTEALTYLQSLTGDQKDEALTLMAKPDEPKTPETPEAASETPAPGTDAKTLAAVAEATATAVVEAAALPGKIKALSVEHGISAVDPEWANRMIANKVPLAQATAMAVELKKHRESLESVSISVGSDRNVESLAAAMSDAICLRAGVKLEKPHERATDFQGMSLIGMTQQYLSTLGVQGVLNMSRAELAELAMSPRMLKQRYGGSVVALAQAVGDFDYILEDSLNKSLRQAYEDQATSWQLWARKAQAPDFKDIKRIALSEVPDLAQSSEGAPIDYVTLSDSREVYALIEYKGGIIITRQTIINDDLDAFSRIPRLQGNAARRKEDAVAYAILTANAAMADSVALFHSDHSNLAGSGAAPSVTTLGAGRTALRKQKGSGSAATLNLTPKTLIIPAALETVSEQLIGSIVDPSKSNQAVNPFSNKLTIATNAILDDTSATAWYLAADSGQIDTVEVCFLEGEEAPVLRQKTDFDTEDLKFAVRHTVAAKAVDHRGLYKNAGA